MRIFVGLSMLITMLLLNTLHVLSFQTMDRLIIINPLVFWPIINLILVRFIGHRKLIK